MSDGASRVAVQTLFLIRMQCWQSLAPAPPPACLDDDTGASGGPQRSCLNLICPLAPAPQVRVVSMPCWELFEEQTQAYKDSVFPPSVTARVSVEAGSKFGWERYIGLNGEHVGISTFGASAPAPTVYEKFGITKAGVVAAAKKTMAHH